MLEWTFCTLLVMLLLSLKSTILDAQLLVWEDGRPTITFGPHHGQPMYEVASSDLDYVNRMLSSSSGASAHLAEFNICLGLAILAEDEDCFNAAISKRYGPAPHECDENIEISLEVDGCRDYQEAHYVASCGICGDDLTESLHEFDDREPDSDDEGWRY